MSATVAKRERKQARKVIGAAGLDLLGQHSQDVRLLMGRLNQLEALIAKRTAEAYAEYAHLWAHAKEDDRRMSALAGLICHTPTVWGRLRWLVKGH